MTTHKFRIDEMNSITGNITGTSWNKVTTEISHYNGGFILVEEMRQGL